MCFMRNPLDFQASLCSRLFFESYLVENPEDRFSCYEAQSRPPINILHRIYQLDLTFCFLILKVKFRNRAMLFDEAHIKLFNTDIGFKRIFCLTV